MKLELNATLKRCAPLGLALLLCAAGASAQMFKWTDSKGVVHFSDQPPTGKDVKVETKSFAAGGNDVALPYELAEAVRNSPVTLYTAADCKACDQGRTLLQQRGIPFSEKTVSTNDDQHKLKEAGSAGQVPLLVVGGTKRVGFEAGAWNEALSNAAYPKQRVLPANYQYPVAVSAAPAPQRPLARKVVGERQAEPVLEPKTPTPAADTAPGFRF
jgi:glutaredoxin